MNRINENVDIVTDETKDVFLLRDLDIERFSKSDPVRKKLADDCEPTEVMTQPTKIV